MESKWLRKYTQMHAQEDQETHAKSNLNQMPNGREPKSRLQHQRYHPFTEYAFPAGEDRKEDRKGEICWHSLQIH